MKGSWKTTTAGIATIIASVATALSAMLDNDPATIPNWTAVIATATTGFGLLFARDNKVTSEQVGAK